MTSETATVAKGVVTRSTDTGMQLDAYPDVWFNRSRPEYDRTGGVHFPGDGSQVEVVYQTASNGKRYVQQFTVLSAGQAGPAIPAGPGPDSAARSAFPSPRYSRDETITRIACLRDAVSLVAAYPNLVDENVELQTKLLAERLVTWVTSGVGDA